MKIRNSFVSNSSSTSFILCIKKQEYEHLDDLIFQSLTEAFPVDGAHPFAYVIFEAYRTIAYTVEKCNDLNDYTINDLLETANIDQVDLEDNYDIFMGSFNSHEMYGSMRVVLADFPSTSLSTDNVILLTFKE